MSLREDFIREECACQAKIFECDCNIKCCTEYGNFNRASQWRHMKKKATMMMKAYHKLINKIDQEIK